MSRGPSSNRFNVPEGFVSPPDTRSLSPDAQEELDQLNRWRSKWKKAGKPSLSNKKPEYSRDIPIGGKVLPSKRNYFPSQYPEYSPAPAPPPNPNKMVRLSYDEVAAYYAKDKQKVTDNIEATLSREGDRGPQNARRRINREQVAQKAVNTQKNTTAGKQARNVVDKAVATKTQKAVEFDLPAGLEEYVSKSVRKAGVGNRLKSVAKVAPYAAGLLIGADVLASRDKTGPTWGLAVGGTVGGLAFFLSRGRISPGKSIFAGAAGYGIGRLGGSAYSARSASLETAHDGTVSGFPEAGEGPIGRKQLTEFGSGWQGMKKVARSIGKIFRRGNPLTKTRGIPKTVATQSPSSIPGSVGEIESKWQGIIAEANLRGAKQVEEMARKRAAGIELRLPTVKQDPYTHPGLQKKLNPTMDLKPVDISRYLDSYAKEKGIPSSNHWGDLNQKTFSPGADAVALAFNKKLGAKVLPTQLLDPKNIGSARTLTPEDIKLQVAQAKLSAGTPGTWAEDVKLFGRGSRPISGNEQTLAEVSPSPAFHKSFQPFNEPKVKAAKGKTHIGSAATVNQNRVEVGVNRIETARVDLKNSFSDGSLYRRGHPRVLEGFRNEGIAEVNRFKNTDFGTGWDPARSLARGIFGVSKKAVKGEKFRKILDDPAFQKALDMGEVIGSLGEGGIGAVDLMQTRFKGKTFKYARKSYLSKGGQKATADIEAARLMYLENEEKGLRALQGSISPTPYGRGKIARAGEDASIPVMYFEAIEGATSGVEAFVKQGGASKAQVDSLKQGLTELHKKGLYHSDIKPANILIDQNDRLVLIDPMPNRFHFLSQESGKNIGQTADLMAADTLASGGTPKAVRGRMNLLANSVTTVASGEKMKSYSRMKPVAREIVEAAGDAEAREYLKFNVKEEISRVQNPFDEIVKEVSPISEDVASVAAGPAAKRRQQARQAHLKAVKRAHANNVDPSTRHKNMDQSNSGPGFIF